MCNCSSTPATQTCTCQRCGAVQTISWNNINFVPDYLSSDNLPAGPIQTELSSAEILDLFTTPIEILATPGPDIVRYPTQILLKMTFGTIAYVSANAIRVRSKHSGASDLFEAAATFLTATGDVYVLMERSGTVNDNVAPDSGWEIYVPSANPTAGDGTISVYVRYETFVIG